MAQIKRTCRERVLIPMGKKLPDKPAYNNILDSGEILPPDRTTILDVGTVAEDFLSARNDNKKFYIFGFVDYVDLGGKMRQSRFCYIYHIPTGFNPTPEGFYRCANCPEAYTRCT